VSDIEIRRDDADSSITYHDPGNAWYTSWIDKSDGRKFKINYWQDPWTTDHFIMTPSGNIWLGATNPTQRLQVNGNIRVTGAVKTTCIWNCF
jgi:hypothetical protein